MSLLHLANELLCSISENLESERDINAFAQANRHLYRLLNSYLYQQNIRQSECSALLWAAQHGQEATAQKLLRELVNYQGASDCYGTPLCVAAMKWHEHIVELLLDNGAGINVQVERYGNALQAASSSGQKRVVNLLLSKDANVNTQGRCYDARPKGFYNTNALYKASKEVTRTS
jgi:ankyrin repeat protein